MRLKQSFKMLGFIMVCTIISFFIILFISAIPEKINRDYAAVLCSYSDKNAMINTNVKVHGKLYHKYLSDPIFKGSVIIDYYDYTKEYELCDITFNKRDNSEMGTLGYNKVVNGQSKVETLGYIWINGNFDNLYVSIIDPSNQVNKLPSDIILSAPAQTRETALAIANSCCMISK